MLCALFLRLPLATSWIFRPYGVLMGMLQKKRPAGAFLSRRRRAHERIMSSCLLQVKRMLDHLYFMLDVLLDGVDHVLKIDNIIELVGQGLVRFFRSRLC